MKCSEAMNPRATIVRANDSIRVAAKTLVEHHVTFVPVLTHDNELAGSLTEHEILRDAVATGLDLFHTSVKHVANLDVLTCGADDDLSAAEQKMKDAHANHIVVVGGESGKAYLGLVKLGVSAGAHAHAPAA